MSYTSEKADRLFNAGNYAEAYSPCVAMAMDGDAVNQGRAGYCNEIGAGTSQSFSRATYWYEKAAAQGDAFAINRLGMLYEKGNGVTKDTAKAVELYYRAASKGHAPAQYNLGACYKFGVGITKDLSVAAYWLKKAADQGDFTAKIFLKQITDDGITSPLYVLPPSFTSKSTTAPKPTTTTTPTTKSPAPAPKPATSTTSNAKSYTSTTSTSRPTNTAPTPTAVPQSAPAITTSSSFDTAYAKAMEYEKNGKSDEAYKRHLELMRKIGDMREYQKVTYAYREKHGGEPDIKAELKRVYFGCAQLARLSYLIANEPYNFNIYYGLSEFWYESGTYNKENKNNGLDYLAKLYTLSDAAARAYKDWFYHTWNYQKETSDNHGPVGTPAEVKYFSAVEDLVGFVGNISIKIQRNLGMGPTEARTYINLFTGEFRPGQWMPYCTQPDMKTWFAKLKQCYNTMDSCKREVVGTLRNELPRNLDPIKAELRRLYGETEAKKIWNEVAQALKNKHSDYFDGDTLVIKFRREIGR